MASTTSSGILSYDYLRRLYIISTGFLGAMEGLIVYYLSYAILKKLRYPIRKPQPLTNYYPSRISGVIALVLVFVYAYTIAKPFSNAAVQNVLQSAGMCGVIYLIFFGYIAGIASKFTNPGYMAQFADKWYVLVFYFINLSMVGLDICLYFRNRE